MKEIEILKEINKNSKVGIDGIDFILEKATDNSFKDMLYDQKQEYSNIYDRSSNLLLLSGEQKQQTPPIQKAMSWMEIQMSTLPQASDSKLAEMLIQGNNMGIIKGTKLLHENIREDYVRNIVSDFISLQQQNIDSLKKYL